MNLLDLAPQFLRRDVTRDGEFHVFVGRVEEADGLTFLCPRCFADNGGAVGTHHVLCWRPGRVPDEVRPFPGRWEFEGTGYGDLTLRARSSSILLLSGCRAHFFITNGKVLFA